MGLNKEKLLLLAASAASASAERAKHGFLLIGDASGIPTLNAANIYGHDRPLALVIWLWAHIRILKAAYGWTDSMGSRS